MGVGVGIDVLTGNVSRFCPVLWMRPSVAKQDPQYSTINM